MAISMLKIRRPLGRLIFNMGIAIPGKTVFLIETAPWLPWFFCINFVSLLPRCPIQMPALPIARFHRTLWRRLINRSACPDNSHVKTFESFSFTCKTHAIMWISYYTVRPKLALLSLKLWSIKQKIYPTCPVSPTIKKLFLTGTCVYAV